MKNFEPEAIAAKLSGMVKRLPIYTALRLTLERYPHYVLAIQTYLDSLETADEEN
jgi:hypothetical protein